MHPIDQLKYFRNKVYLTDKEEEELKRKTYYQHDGNEHSMVFAKNRSAKLPTNYSQIREQMCLETHFQYEFSFLGCFGQSGCREKEIQTAISMLLLRPAFLCFHGEKNFNL